MAAPKKASAEAKDTVVKQIRFAAGLWVVVKNISMLSNKEAPSVIIEEAVEQYLCKRLGPKWREEYLPLINKLSQID